MPQAPELRVPYWIDAKGEERAALTLKELGTGSVSYTHLTLPTNREV